MGGQRRKANTLGFIGSFPIPSVVRNIDSRTLGAQAVTPKVTTKAIWVNTWYDPGKERQAADTLIAQGAANAAQNSDSPASIPAAQGQGPYPGAIKDNGGKEMVAAGSVMPDATFSSLNWYVEGIEGSVPK